MFGWCLVEPTLLREARWIYHQMYFDQRLIAMQNLLEGILFFSFLPAQEAMLTSSPPNSLYRIYKIGRSVQVPLGMPVRIEKWTVIFFFIDKGPVTFCLSITTQPPSPPSPSPLLHGSAEV